MPQSTQASNSDHTCGYCVDSVSQEIPSGVLLSLQSLSRVEMYVFIAVTRLHLRLRGGSTGKLVSLAAGAGALPLKAPAAGHSAAKDRAGFNAEQVVCEVESLTGLLKKKVQLCA